MTKLPALASLSDIRSALKNLPGPDREMAAAAARREPQLTKPPGSLGRLEELSAWLSQWQGFHPPRMDRPGAHVFAGNHGVVAQGVSAYPAAVTEQMVENFRLGGAAINQMCKTFNVGLGVEAMALDQPTADFTQGPAMSETEFVEAFVFGANVMDDDLDVLCLGEMGIGNTTAAAAIGLALYGGDARDWTGPGTGVEGEALRSKMRAVQTAVETNRAAMAPGGQADGLEVLRCLGGRETAAIAGAVLGARYRRIPVLLDGYVSTAAAAPLQTLAGDALHHCQVAHVSAEPAHRRLIEAIGKRALLDLGMRLGEATGAVLAVGTLRAAVNCHAGMATFAEAGVTDKE